jgi:hypothetical protein
MKARMAYRTILLSSVLLGATSYAQEDQITGGITGCEDAVLFCNDLSYTVESDVMGGCCIWFKFIVPTYQQIAIGVGLTGQSPGMSSTAAIVSGNDCNSIPACTSIPGFVAVPTTFNSFMNAGIYYLVVRTSNGELPCSGLGTIDLDVQKGDISCDSLECENCIPDFAPERDKPYIVSAWARLENAPQTDTDFEEPVITVESIGTNGLPVGTTYTITCSGNIVDGWQRMEGPLMIDVAAVALRINMTCTDGTCYFDDVRFFPQDGSMKCYVYDPTNLRFTAELDERHYATFYEYDGEGKLVRVKKETERGVMTIQETRYNSSHLTSP